MHKHTKVDQPSTLQGIEQQFQKQQTQLQEQRKEMAQQHQLQIQKLQMQTQHLRKVLERHSAILDVAAYDFFLDAGIQLMTYAYNKRRVPGDQAQLSELKATVLENAIEPDANARSTQSLP